MTQSKLKSFSSSSNFSLDISRRRFLVAAGTFAAGMMAGPLMAAGSRESYAQMLRQDRALRGYWRFDGDLVDVLGKSQAKASGATAFTSGAMDGKAISLEPNAPILVPGADKLKGRATTLELFFRVDAKPSGEGNPVIIAQSNGKAALFVIGVKHDLSGLLYQNNNGMVVTEINLPTDQPIEVGRWYHFALTSFDLDVRAYIDGYECSLVGGAYEYTRKGPKKTTMTLGSTPVNNGWGSTHISIDEVACYARGLTAPEIQAHLAVAGPKWQKHLKETGAIVSAVEAKRDALRDAKAQAILNDPGLVQHGESTLYEGERLEAINFMVGGIGAGAIQFNGNAEPAIWQIGCNYEEHRVEDSFLAVRAQAAGGQPLVRALQTKAAGAFAPMKSLKFIGEYPFGQYKFEEPALPVEVELEVFNPFIPMNLKGCAIPCAIYTVTAKNTSNSKVKADVLAAQKNALGYNEGKGKGDYKYGSNQNEVLKQGETTLLHMTRSGNDSADMVLMTLAAGASGTAEWDVSQSLQRDLVTSGSLDGAAKSKVSPDGQSVNGALSAPIELAPGETMSVTFVLTWYFQNNKHGSGKMIALEGEGRSNSVGWSGQGHNYTNWWSDAMGVAAYMQDNIEDLTARTRLFHKTLYASTLPVWLLDRMSSQLAVLRSQTFWWAKNGYLGMWEGCNEDDGCCAGNCTHVYHYAQAHARLLPEMGRLMRDQDYERQTEKGVTPYRHTNKVGAADGFYGTILNTYREHLCSKDDSWLQSVWPKVKKGMDWSIDYWNPSRDGFMETTQHNTLDGDFSGCSSWIGSMYLAALEAAARMADIVGDRAVAAEYRKIRESGKQLQNKRLWNGEYYIQEPGKKRSQDYLDGCHIDQILGEWWADQVEIDRCYPKERSRQAMESLLKYNFLTDFHGHSLKPRQYCEVTDGGMKMITWPKNPQPIPGMKYGDEVMTGFEYSAAVAMIQNGLLKEGLMVMKVIYDRYNGRLRTKGVSNVRNGPWGYSGNPFGDDECGKFYGRSLSVWSALLALQGFHYDGPKGEIAFRPVLTPEDHKSFFTAAEAYGLYSQQRSTSELKATLNVSEGEVSLRNVILNAGEGQQAKSAQVKLGARTLPAKLESNGSDLRLAFQSAIVLKAGEVLDIQVSLV
ncbi:GH116 family glycosyl hydrolase [Coraliomargarita algicola]|uniref:GH116 family glycosyl hydrolase n=1 Tax=Coraliomargarita algicola TaxID=3092156 RepID=A0ABZ0RND6_9BACT|nr:GH116 family glycosyl hydrolase [Coraliomargarita sp. J2-16]WPJ97032.1 GH116 family glycosyl hydrolase [Coraliomargarita sp. J2-16]